jgi:hypothetical protein
MRLKLFSLLVTAAFSLSISAFAVTEIPLKEHLESGKYVCFSKAENQELSYENIVKRYSTANRAKKIKLLADLNTCCTKLQLHPMNIKGRVGCSDYFIFASDYRGAHSDRLTHIAARHDAAGVLAFLSRLDGVDIDRPNFDNDSPAMLAAHYGSINSIKFLFHLDSNGRPAYKIDKTRKSRATDTYGAALYEIAKNSPINSGKYEILDIITGKTKIYKEDIGRDIKDIFTDITLTYNQMELKRVLKSSPLSDIRKVFADFYRA